MYKYSALKCVQVPSKKPWSWIETTQQTLRLNLCLLIYISCVLIVRSRTVNEPRNIDSVSHIWIPIELHTVRHHSNNILISCFCCYYCGSCWCWGFCFDFSHFLCKVSYFICSKCVFTVSSIYNTYFGPKRVVIEPFEMILLMQAVQWLHWNLWCDSIQTSALKEIN